MTPVGGAGRAAASISRLRGLGTDGALLATALVGAAALSRMASGGLGGAAAGPLLATAAAGSIVPGIVLRRRVPLPK